MSLTTEQSSIIKSTVPILQDHGIALCELFYKNMLSDNPGLNAVFSQTNQKSGAQQRALAGSLLAYAQHIDDPSALAPALEHISQKHASMYILPEQYETVATYLLNTMAELLGPSTFTHEVEDAWAAGYWQLANLMIEREKQLYKTDPEWNNWRNFVVERKVPEAEGLVSLYLRPQDGQQLPAYLPGQFVSINVHVPQLGYNQTRQYSLSDQWRPDHYRVSIKKGETENRQDNLPNGVVSNIIHDNVKVGDVIEMSRPRGVFHLDLDDDTDRPLALLSAGSGITPMMAILESLASKKSQRQVWWVHVTRNSKAHAFKERVAELARQLGTVKILTLYTQPLPEDEQERDHHIAGRICPHDLLRHGNPTGSDCFVCGPAGFMNNISTELKSCGVPEERIKMELFGTGGLPEPSG